MKEERKRKKTETLTSLFNRQNNAESQDPPGKQSSKYCRKNVEMVVKRESGKSIALRRAKRVSKKRSQCEGLPPETATKTGAIGTKIKSWTDQRAVEDDE